MTQAYRAFKASQKIDIGRKLKEFVSLAVPDMTHIMVLARLVEAGRDGCSLSHLRTGVQASKSEVNAVLALFRKLGIVESRGLIAKKYYLPRAEPKAELAVRLVKLWEHPQGHASVLEAIREQTGQGKP
jgi:DNA-binding IclR family transcriptional regulator